MATPNPLAVASQVVPVQSTPHAAPATRSATAVQLEVVPMAASGSGAIKRKRQGTHVVPVGSDAPTAPPAIPAGGVPKVRPKKEAKKAAKKPMKKASLAALIGATMGSPASDDGSAQKVFVDSPASRNRCAACYREFNRMEHLVEHMRASHHSAHEPRCGVCGKHCRSLDALRDHLGFGSVLPKAGCARAFAAQGCPLCLAVFPASGASLRSHRAACQLSRAPTQSQLTRSMSRMSLQGGGHGGAVALGCKMVGGGSDGTLDVCARVCVVDEDEIILYKSFVKPLIPVTHYRYKTTGISPEHLRDAMANTVKQARKRVEDILLNGEQPWKLRTARGGARLLVGHGLDHDLDGLGIDYPAYLMRDTATYPPLMKTSSRQRSNSLKFLTRSCLGYEIQTGGLHQHQHPYDDCVAAMRLYKRMRALRHGKGDRGDGAGCARPPAASVAEAFPAWRQRELERMSPEELLRMSKPDYHCWCLDD